MIKGHVLKIINIVFPAIGIGLMIFYDVCETGCSSLQGTFMGLKLKVIGIIFMVVLLVLSLPPGGRNADFVRRLRMILLSGALGGETVLVRFQAVQDVYCYFCLAFGLCILILFVANFTKVDRYWVLGGFLSGIAAFAIFFEGSVLPLYR